MVLGIIITYVIVSYIVGFHLFMNGGGGWGTWLAWAFSPVIVVPAFILLLIAG